MHTQKEDQKIYSCDELNEMFNNVSTVMNNLFINPILKKTYDTLKEQCKINENGKYVSENIAQRDTDDLCPVCLDELQNGDELDYCKYSCGKHIHKTCFQMWTKQHPANCVFCRHSWYDNSKEKYISLTSSTQ